MKNLDFLNVKVCGIVLKTADESSSFVPNGRKFSE